MTLLRGEYRKGQSVESAHSRANDSDSVTLLAGPR